MVKAKLVTIIVVAFGEGTVAARKLPQPVIRKTDGSSARGSKRNRVTAGKQRKFWQYNFTYHTGLPLGYGDG